jgi:hypothetical protein
MNLGIAANNEDYSDSYFTYVPDNDFRLKNDVSIAGYTPAPFSDIGLARNENREAGESGVTYSLGGNMSLIYGGGKAKLYITGGGVSFITAGSMGTRFSSASLFENESVTLTLPFENGKIFIWDSLGGMRPKVRAVRIP